MYHIVFKKHPLELNSEGVTLQGELISCIQKQKKDFKNSHIVAVYETDGLYVETLYKKHVERWNNSLKK